MVDVGLGGFFGKGSVGYCDDGRFFVCLLGKVVYGWVRMGGMEEEESESEWCGNVVYIVSYSYLVVIYLNIRISLCLLLCSCCKLR